jgi:hypothetical protein
MSHAPQREACHPSQDLYWSRSDNPQAPCIGKKKTGFRLQLGQTERKLLPLNHSLRVLAKVRRPHAKGSHQRDRADITLAIIGERGRAINQQKQ